MNIRRYDAMQYAQTMKHHRSPTHSYPPLSLHATLALRHTTTTTTTTTTPTLLSPLSSTHLDDFQSNAWLNAWPPLTGLGITCTMDPDQILHEQPFDPIHIDGDARRPALPTEISDHLPAPTHHSSDTRRVVQFASSSFHEIGFDNDIDPAACDVIGLIPDVNMYDSFRQHDLPHLGINPLDTISSTSISYGEPTSSTLDDHDTDNIISATDSRPEQSPSPRVIQDIMSILVPPRQDFSFLPCSCAGSPSMQAFSPSQPAAPRSVISVRLEPAHCENESEPLLAPRNFEYANTTHPSPVLNAHLGIELGELISRAERFRNKYPDRDIDRAWLSHFAGKLSDRGELLNDFRCYVIGCDQRNKRRDHILVHVGAHIGQRPFACSVCPLRFLRKNECKRHEASHSGFRPYSCDICGQSFVRQDLVKRHVKRTHGLKDETGRQPRKKARLE